MPEEVDVSNVSNQAVQDLVVFLQQFSESQIREILSTIAYKQESEQNIIIARSLVKRVAQEIQSQTKISASEEIIQLSSSFANRFPSLLQHFQAWIPHRKDLVEQSESCACKLDRNSVLASLFKIVTSVADIAASWRRMIGYKENWTNFVLEYGFTAVFLSIFLHLTFAKRLNNKVKILLEMDQEKFQPIKQWFQQSTELDRAIRNYFPYGIDQDLVLAINKSAANSDEYTKIFMSIIASNAKEGVKLFQDRDFLDKADKFSTSHTGVIWFRKVLMENDPVYIECLKFDMEDQIKSISKKIEENSKTEKPDISDLIVIVPSIVKAKFLLNGLLITSAFCNICDLGKSEESRILRKLAQNTKKELRAMNHVLHFLKPEGTEIVSLE